LIVTQLVPFRQFLLLTSAARVPKYSLTGADVLFSVKINWKTRGQEHADCSNIKLPHVYLKNTHFKFQSTVTTGRSVVFLVLQDEKFNWLLYSSLKKTDNNHCLISFYSHDVWSLYASWITPKSVARWNLLPRNVHMWNILS
jgi:hypothetical protein